MIRYLKAMWQFAKYQPWVDYPDWHDDDARSLQAFLKSGSGLRFKAALVNAVLRQQASAMVSEKSVDRAVGYANGFRGCVTFVESLTEVPESDS